MENNLPEGWVSVKVEDIAFTASGGTPSTNKKEYWENGNIPWINSGTLKDNIISKPSHYITELGLKNSSAKLFPENSVVIALTGATTGKVGMLDFECSANQSVTALYPSEFNCPKFLFYFLLGSRDEIVGMSLGSAQPHINKFIVDNLTVPLPPLPEQHRIVSKLEALFEKIETNKKRLEKIPQILKRFRQSVLADAVNNNGLEQFTKNVCEEIQIGPFGTQLHRHDYISNGIPLVNPTHIQGGVIIPDLNLTISRIKYEELSNYHLKEGDVIMGRRGEMARCGLVGLKENGWFCGTGSLFFRPDLKKIVPQYLYWVLSNSQTKSFLESEAKGSTMSNLNLDIVKNIPITLPSINVQLSIVKKVEDLFAFADKIESRYLKAKTQLDKLPQSILAKAFRGELVPQDPEDEPASQLLERILTAKRKK
jgi:type I restriction enzyme, S subunit